mmetsp:Transcript_12220/g.30785  ORF Transcript_12220/g.30785 Transcript_12220/m.30785 type:complete len:351 (-) Transcript_12220:559-1611(-)
MLDLALVVQDDVSLLQEVLVLLLCLLEHDHGLLVDVLAEALLLRGELVEAGLVVLVAVGLEVEVCALLAEEAFLLLDPRVLLLHASRNDVGLLVVFLQLLDLVADPLLLQLLLLPLLLVSRELGRQICQVLVQLLQLGPEGLKLGAELRVRRPLLLEPVLELGDLGDEGFVTLARGLVLALLCLELVADHLEFNVGLLRLLTLLLELLDVLLLLDLELLDLLLEILDALLPTRLQALDVLLELLGQLLKPLFLLRKGLDVGLALHELRPHLGERLLRGVMLTGRHPLVDELQLVLLTLHLVVNLHVLGGHGLHLLQLSLSLLPLLARRVHALLQVGHLLQPHQQIPPLRR